MELKQKLFNRISDITMVRQQKRKIFSRTGTILRSKIKTTMRQAANYSGGFDVQKRIPPQRDLLYNGRHQQSSPQGIQPNAIKKTIIQNNNRGKIFPKPAFNLQTYLGKSVVFKDDSGINFVNHRPVPAYKFKISWPTISINALPRPHIALRSVPSWSIFLGLALLFLSAFPLLQAINRTYQNSTAVLGAATAGYDNLISAQNALTDSNYEAANLDLSKAYRNFDNAMVELRNLNALTGLTSQAQQGKKLILAAQEATLGLQYLAIGLDSLKALQISPAQAQSQSAGVTKPLQSALANLNEAYKYFSNSQTSLADVNIGSLPQAYQEKISRAQDLFKQVVPSLREVADALTLVADFASGDKTYLLLFQNNRELRATGGFIGTYGLLRLTGGDIADLKISSIYDPDGQLKQKIAAPGPLQRNLTTIWAMRDSNWFFNFPQSAAKAAEFLNLEIGVKVDGVFAFTPKLFEQLLLLTGPIELPSYGEVLTAENFVDKVQYQTSEIYDRKLNQPKKFLADFAPLLLQRLSALEKEQRLTLLDILFKSLSQKDVQLYSNEPSIQSRLITQNWAGQVNTTPGDYLAVVNSNVGAGKTDQDIRQDIRMESRVMPDGSARNSLTILRKHLPGNEKEFPVNVDFVRIYVPKGAKLLLVSGFDNLPFIPAAGENLETDRDLAAVDAKTTIDALSNTLSYEEYDKTVFANWVVLPPGQEREIHVEYQLPWRYDLSSQQVFHYTLALQKQAGTPPTIFRSIFYPPENRTIIWQYPENLITSQSAVEFSTDWESDKFWGALFR